MPKNNFIIRTNNQQMRKYNRYQQSPVSQSFMDLKAKQPPTPTPKTSFSNTHNKNPQTELLRLPALNNMRRSSSISLTERNTKFKLQNLDEKLEELSANVHNTRLEAQETITHIRYLTSNVAGIQLNNARDDLRKQVKGFERLVAVTIAADEERYANVRSDCGELWDQTEKLRQSLFELQMRIDKLDLGMGFKDK